MRVISRKTLKDFYEQKTYEDSKSSLESWYQEAVKAHWNNPNDIKAQYRNASFLKDNRIIFNIHGNKYRLIVKINYLAKIVFIRFVGTHEQYDKIDAGSI